MSKESTCLAGDRRCRFDPLVGKTLRGGGMATSPVFLPAESLWTEEPEGLWSIKATKSDTTEVTSHTHVKIIRHTSFGIRLPL